MLVSRRSAAATASALPPPSASADRVSAGRPPFHRADRRSPSVERARLEQRLDQRARPLPSPAGHVVDVGFDHDVVGAARDARRRAPRRSRPRGAGDRAIGELCRLAAAPADALGRQGRPSLEAHVATSARIAAPVGVTKLGLDVDAVRRHAAQAAHRRGRGERQHAVARLDEAAPHRQRRPHDLGAEVRNRGGRADDVDDRVHGADLVEVHLIERHLVDLRLRLAEPAEDPPRQRAHRRLEVRVLDGPSSDRSIEKVRSGWFALDVDVSNVIATNAAPGGQCPRWRWKPSIGSACDRALDDQERHAEVEERRDRHVARDAAERVEEQRLARPLSCCRAAPWSPPRRRAGCS